MVGPKHRATGGVTVAPKTSSAYTKTAEQRHPQSGWVCVIRGSEVITMETETPVVPRIIHCFWHSPVLPWFVRRCIDTWKDTGWTINLIHDGTPHCTTAPQNYDLLSVQHRSDWRRLDAMVVHGGVWLDATTISLANPDSWFDPTEKRLQGFIQSVPGSFLTSLGLGDVGETLGCELIMENWAFAAPPQHPFLNDWRREFKAAIEQGLQTYCSGKPFVHCPQLSLPYHTQHLCFAVVKLRRGLKETVLRSSHTGGGPLDYTLYDLISAPALPGRYLIKLSGWTRSVLIQLLQTGIYLEGACIPLLLGFGTLNFVNSK